MRRLALGFLLIALPRCGGIAIIDDDGESAPEEPRPCGRPEDAPCGADEFCDYPEGACAGEGICRARPSECPAPGTSLCGCDGVVYASACDAQQHGVDSAGDSVWCPLIPAARARFAEREMVLAYVDPPLGSCIQLFAERGAVSVYPITMWSTWQTTSIRAVQSMDQCLQVWPDDGGRPGDVVASQASGSVGLLENPQGCLLDVDLVIDFPSADWLATPVTVAMPEAGIENGTCP